MEYRALGKSGMMVSEIGYGCMSLGKYQPINEFLLRSAFDAGVNFFDTADLYQQGFNEESVGKALKPIRSSVFIATKVGNQWRTDGSGWDWNPTKVYIISAVEESLKRLQTDYIDLYQLHGGTIDDPIDETIEAFEILKAEGKIRHYGLSSIRPNVIRAFAEKSNIVSVMMQYSLLDRRPEEFTLDFLYQQQIGVFVRGAIAKGLLAGKAATPYLGYSEEEVNKMRLQLASMAEDDYPMARLALSYVLHHPAVSSIALGISAKEQLISNLGKIRSLSTDEIEKLKEVLEPKVYEKHR